MAKLSRNHAEVTRFTRFRTGSSKYPAPHDVARSHNDFRVRPEGCRAGFRRPESVPLSTESSTAMPAVLLLALAALACSDPVAPERPEPEPVQCAATDTVGGWVIPPPGDICYGGGLTVRGGGR